MENHTQYRRVHFRLYCRTKLGQSVGLGGNSFSLGSIDKEAIIPLVTTPESYPIWFTDNPILLRKDEVYDYKYCLVEGGKPVTFENIIRKASVADLLEETILEDTFDFSAINEIDIDSEAQLLSEIENLKKIHQKRGTVPSDSRVIIVCYHLPVSVSRTNDPDNPFEAEWAESLIAKSKNSIATSVETSWYGTIDVPGDILTFQEERKLADMLENMNCYPIFIEKNITDKAYLGYCKTILWPIFHNIDQLDTIHAAWNLPQYRSTLNESSSKNNMSTTEVLDWNENLRDLVAAYQSVNEKFMKTILPKIKLGDIVWVHDYHLIPLPKLLRENTASTLSAFSIVFFLHLPFPTSQIFRTLPTGNDLLFSMTCADVVGFHSFDHARHFLNASKRMLGIRSCIRQGGMLSLKVKNREVIVTMSHVSVETDLIDAAVANPSTQQMAADIRKRYGDKKIIVGVDVCQRLSGGSLKLAAYDKLLTDYASTMGKTVLIQKSLCPKNRLEDEAVTSSDLKKMVQNLNMKFSKNSDTDCVIDYTEISHLGINERVALWLVADVFLLTSVREGLNLLPLEYVYARKDLPFAGVVVASEFTACSSLLSGSLKVNPFYTLNVADTLHRALEMSSKECAQRLQRDLPFVANHPSSKWTSEILQDLEFLRQSSANKSQTHNIFNCQPIQLQLSDILKAYDTASDDSIANRGRRLFVFDYGGCLLQKEKFDVYMKHTLSAIAGRKPSDTVLESIRKLSADPQNAVMVLTGLTKVKLKDVFVDMENVTIGTSSGLIYSWGANLTAFNQDGGDGVSRQWGCLDFSIDWDAVRNIAVPIMTKFTYRTNGTCLSPRFPGIGWSYFGADPEWGECQANQLQVELEAALANHDVKVVSQIQGSIEIVPKVLNKGLIVKLFLKKVMAMRAGQMPKFVMIAGDEPSDEKMFDAFYEMIRDAPSTAGVRNVSAFTIIVGKKESSANYFLNDVKDVEDLLDLLAKSTTTKEGL